MSDRTVCPKCGKPLATKDDMAKHPPRGRPVVRGQALCWYRFGIRCDFVRKP